jgi:dTDP-4-dehydrorhamnose reductase
VIVNCAAWTDVDAAETHQSRAFEVNQRGAAVVARAARELQIPLVQISTDYVFSGKGSQPWRVYDET